MILFHDGLLWPIASLCLYLNALTIHSASFCLRERGLEETNKLHSSFAFITAVSLKADASFFQMVFNSYEMEGFPFIFLQLISPFHITLTEQY